MDLTASLPAIPAGALLGFRYWTDVAAVEPGFQVDNITLGGTVIGTAENENEGWTFDGFRTTTGTEIADVPELPTSRRTGSTSSYDTSLQTAYNFGFLDSRPDWVETYPYQNGLLINYWDTSQNDNNVGDHPGEGLILPVDAHPTPEHWSNGQLMRQRIQTLRLDVRARAHRRDHAAPQQRADHDRVQAGCAGLRRHEDVVVRR